jgi:hypothetical protein
MSLHEELAVRIDELVQRQDHLCELAKGNHCLTRPDGPWTRKVALTELFKDQYTEKTVQTILHLLKPDKASTSYDGRTDYEF